MKRRQVMLSLQGALSDPGHPPSIIVWPEVPAPLYYFEDPVFRGYVNNLARTMNAYVLLGIVAHTPDGAPLNSAALISPEGIAVSRYDKVNLVPFGEFVPWPFGFANKISTEIGDFAPGNRVVVSPVGTHKIATFICYESVFPNFVRKFAAGGADIERPRVGAPLFRVDVVVGQRASIERQRDALRCAQARGRYAWGRDPPSPANPSRSGSTRARESRRSPC